MKERAEEGDSDWTCDCKGDCKSKGGSRGEDEYEGLQNSEDYDNRI